MAKCEQRALLANRVANANLEKCDSITDLEHAKRMGLDLWLHNDAVDRARTVQREAEAQFARHIAEHCCGSS